MKSILLIGQSNMAGRGFLDDVEPIINENIKVLKNGRWQFMDEPIHSDRSVAGIGPAASFAAEWIAAHPNETLGLIPCADGGTSIEYWSTNQPLTRHAISEAKFAMESSKIIGILWHQGESDSNNGNFKQYKDKLITLIHHFRNELHNETLPFVIGGLGDYLGKTGFGKSAPEYAEINKIFEEICTSESNCYYATGIGLQANPDGIHINAKSQRIFGVRYYDAFSKRHNVVKPLVNEQQRVAQIYDRKLTKNEQLYVQFALFSKNKISFDTFNERMATIHNS